MADFSVRSDHVDVEQIMRQIRARIRDKRGADYTEQEIRELASVKLDRFLDPRAVRSDLLEHYRREREASPLIRPEERQPPLYEFNHETVYASDRGLAGRILTTIRKLLRPCTKLFFHVDTIWDVLSKQSRMNAQHTALFQRFDQHITTRDALNFEMFNNLVVELTRLGIEVKNLRMQVESFGTRLDFDERRARALEGVVQYRPGAPVARPPQAPAGSGPAPGSGPGPGTGTGTGTGEDGGDEDDTTEGGETRSARRRRRRRGRRRGPGEGDGPEQGQTEQGQAAPGQTGPGQTGQGQSGQGQGAQGPGAQGVGGRNQPGQGQSRPGQGQPRPTEGQPSRAESRWSEPHPEESSATRSEETDEARARAREQAFWSAVAPRSAPQAPERGAPDPGTSEPNAAELNAPEPSAAEPNTTERIARESEPPETASSEAAWHETASRETVPSETVSSGTGPSDTASSETASSETASSDTASSGTASSETASPETAPSDATTSPAPPEEPDDARSDRPTFTRVFDSPRRPGPGDPESSAS